MLNVASLRDFERFLRSCALRSAQVLNRADLARDVGISPSTANEWLSVLVASNVITLLEPWFYNQSKSITKSPKLFLADTGLLLHLLNVRSIDELHRSPLLGSIWETFVFAELRKRQERETGSWMIHFYRDRNKEVDFVIQRGGRFDLIEVKWSEHPTQHDAARMHQVEHLLGKEKIGNKMILCRTQNRYPIDQDVVALSLEDLDRE